MKKCSVATILVFLVLNASLFAAEGRFAGTVTDDMCGRKHTMMPGKPDSDCVRACVKAGRKHELVVGEKFYTLEGQSAEVDRLAAKQVRVTGDLAADVVHVATIETAK